MCKRSGRTERTEIAESDSIVKCITLSLSDRNENLSHSDPVFLVSIRMSFKCQLITIKAMRSSFRNHTSSDFLRVN